MQVRELDHQVQQFSSKKQNTFAIMQSICALFTLYL